MRKKKRKPDLTVSFQDHQMCDRFTKWRKSSLHGRSICCIIRSADPASPKSRTCRTENFTSMSRTLCAIMHLLEDFTVVHSSQVTPVDLCLMLIVEHRPGDADLYCSCTVHPVLVHKSHGRENPTSLSTNNSGTPEFCFASQNRAAETMK